MSPAGGEVSPQKSYLEKKNGNRKTIFQGLDVCKILFIYYYYYLYISKSIVSFQINHSTVRNGNSSRPEEGLGGKEILNERSQSLHRSVRIALFVTVWLWELKILVGCCKTIICKRSKLSYANKADRQHVGATP